MFTIHPRVTNWENQRVWVFDDPDRGLLNEGLVSGTDLIMDRLSANIPNADKGFALSFSDEPFDGYEVVFDLVKSSTGEGLAEGVMGNWYSQKDTGFSGWLCPALFKYFKFAPQHIYVKAEPWSIDAPEKAITTINIEGK